MVRVPAVPIVQLTFVLLLLVAGFPPVGFLLGILEDGPGVAWRVLYYSHTRKLVYCRQVGGFLWSITRPCPYADNCVDVVREMSISLWDGLLYCCALSCCPWTYCSPTMQDRAQQLTRKESGCFPCQETRSLGCYFLKHNVWRRQGGCGEARGLCCQ